MIYIELEIAREGLAAATVENCPSPGRCAGRLRLSRRAVKKQSVIFCWLIIQIMRICQSLFIQRRVMRLSAGRGGSVMAQEFGEHRPKVMLDKPNCGFGPSTSGLNEAHMTHCRAGLEPA
jgi:hypothetical protein